MLATTLTIYQHEQSRARPQPMDTLFIKRNLHPTREMSLVACLEGHRHPTALEHGGKGKLLQSWQPAKHNTNYSP